MLLRLSARRLAPLLLLAACVSFARAESAAASKTKLTQVQRDLDKKRKDLERYRQKVRSLQQRLGQEQDRVESYRSERERLEAKRRRASREKNRLQGHLSSIEGDLEEGKDAATGAAQLYYSRAAVDSPYVSGDALWAGVALRRQVSAELGRFHGLRTRFEAASHDAQDAVERAEELLARSREAKQREREAERKLKERRRDLELTRTRLERTEGRIKTLEASAASLDRLVSRLAKRHRPAAKQAPVRTAAKVSLARTAEAAEWPGPASLSRSLPWPAEGSLVTRFGRQKIEGIGTPILHRGIRIATELGARVVPVRAGRVVYAGPFRSYGDVVILDHGAGLVTVYGHLGKVLTAAGEDVAVGDSLGTAGDSQDAEAQLVKLPEGKGSVYFEIRKGNRAVDPLKWLRRK